MDTDVIALIIAAVSLLVAGLSLGWQIALWLLSAARPKATLLHGMTDGAGVYSGPVSKSRKPIDLRHLHRQQIRGTEVLGIQVTNHGRLPVLVERVAVRTHGGVMSYVPHGNLIGETMPFKVEPGTKASWYVRFDDAVRLASVSRDVLHEPVDGIYMTAHLGTGKAIRTRRVLNA